VDVREQLIDAVTVLAVEGRVDSTTAPILGERLAAVQSHPGARLVVDCHELEYITSAGFQALLQADRRAVEDGRRLVLCDLNPKVQQLFDLADFLDRFPIVPSRDDALRLQR